MPWMCLHESLHLYLFKNTLAYPENFCHQSPKMKILHLKSLTLFPYKLFHKYYNLHNLTPEDTTAVDCH
jgi:hypothetical protein